VDLEATSYPQISLLEIGRDIMPTPQGCEGNYAYLLGVKTLPLLRSRHNIPPTPTPRDLCRLGS